MPIEAIPKEVSHVVIQCLAISPGQRPETAWEIGSVILKALDEPTEKIRSALAEKCDAGFRAFLAPLLIKAAQAQIKSHRDQAYGLLREALTLDNNNTEALSLLEDFPSPALRSIIPWKKFAAPAVLFAAGLGATLWVFNKRALTLPSAAETLSPAPSQSLAKKPKSEGPKPIPPSFQLKEKQTAISGRLVISGLPPDARLSLDGKPLAAEGPMTTITVNSGLRVLALTRNNKIIWRDSVHVPPHAQIKVHISLE
jgi:hypothetical protein